MVPFEWNFFLASLKMLRLSNVLQGIPQNQAKVWSSGQKTRLKINKLWVQISYHSTLDGNGVKAVPGSFPVPNPGSNQKVKKENLGNQMGHAEKYF